MSMTYGNKHKLILVPTNKSIRTPTSGMTKESQEQRSKSIRKLIKQPGTTTVSRMLTFKSSVLDNENSNKMNTV